MLTARCRIFARVEPVWWHGVTLEGAIGWDPSLIHPSALNHALGHALGEGGLREERVVFNGRGRRLWHSRVAPSFWASPAVARRDTLEPVEVTLVSSAADYGGLILPPIGKGSRLALNPDRTPGAPGMTLGRDSGSSAVGKPKLLTGWLGQWDFRLFMEETLAREVPAVLRITLGPMDATCEVERLDDWTPVVMGCPDGAVEADHLIDPTLVRGEVAIEAIGCAPWSVGRVAANAQAGEHRIFWYGD